MATGSSRDVTLSLSVETLGADNVKKLQSAIQSLADEGSNASPEFQKLADEVSRLGQQNQAIATLKNVGDEANRLGDMVSEVSTEFNNYATKLGTAKDATQGLREAQRAANQEFLAADEANKRAARAIDAYRDATDTAGRKTQEYRDEIARLKDIQTEAAIAVTKTRAALSDSNKELTAAVSAQAKLQGQTEKSEESLKKFTRELGQQKGELDKATNAAEALGVSTTDLAASEDGLLDSFNAAGIAAKKMADDMRAAAAAQKIAEEQARAAAAAQVEAQNKIAAATAAAAAASKASAAAINNAFGTIGIRGVQAVEKEIQDVRAAMLLLQSSGAATGSALRTAFAAGETKIKGLEQEIRSLNGTLTMADRAANLFKNSMGQIAAGNIIADGLGYLVNKVKEMGRSFVQANLDIERLTRTMTQITGSAEGAAQKIAFLQKVSNLAGTSISSTTDAFIKFQAAAAASGIEASEIDSIFQAVAVSGSRMGLSADRIALSLEALSQIASKGTLSMEELRQQLGDSLPGATMIAAKGLGLTVEQLTKMVSQGQITAQEFFPAFKKGLAEAFGDPDKKVEGLLQSFYRLQNQFTMLFQKAKDSSALVALGKTMDLLAENFDAAVLAVKALATSFAALKIVNFVQGFAAAGVALRATTVSVVEQTAATVVNTVQTELNTVATGANAAATRLQTAARTASVGAMTAARGAMTSLAATMTGAAAAARGLYAALGGPIGLLVVLAVYYKELGTAVGEYAASLTDAGDKMKEYDRAMAAQAAKEKAIGEEYKRRLMEEDQLRKKEVLGLQTVTSAVEASVAAAKKSAEAQKERASLIEQSAALYGEETRTLDAAAQAASGMALSLGFEAKVRADLVSAMEKEVAKRQELIDKSTSYSAKAAEELVALKEKLAVKKGEAEASLAVAQAAAIEAANKEIVAEAYKDNTLRVKEFTDRLTAARVEMARLNTLKKEGVDVSKEYSAAQIEEATATRLQKDALEDQKKTQEAATRAKKADVDLKMAGLNVEMAVAQAEEKSALAAGRTTDVIKAKVTQKKIELAILKLTIEAMRAEAAAAIASAKAQLSVLEVSDPLYKAKKAELDLTIKLAEIKAKEADAREASVGTIEDEIYALKNNTKAQAENAKTTDALTGAISNQTRAREASIAAMEKENELRAKEKALEDARLNRDSEGFSLNTGGKRVQGMGASKEFVLEAAKSRGLSDEEALELADLFYKNDMGPSNWGNSDTFGGAWGESWFTKVNKEVNKRAAKNMERGVTDGSSQSASGNGGGQMGGGQTVTINIGGRSSTVGMASAADANALTGILRTLETSSGTST